MALAAGLAPVRPSLSALAAHPAVIAAALALVALLTRLPVLGDPAYSGDEAFYLLVGDRMWRGALPYVDIWDRKPIGLFLIYAALRPLSATGLVAVQLAAAAAAVATAAVLVRIAARVAAPPAALAAGILYLAVLACLGGAAGQSPVFYNLLTALAALLVTRAGEWQAGQGRPGRPGQAPAWPYGLAAMLLFGLAIQVKSTAFIEGVGLGLVLLWRDWRARGSLAGTLRFAVPLVGVAVAPTALAFAAYAAAGHGAAFVQANVLSIFQRHNEPEVSHAFLRSTLLGLTPLLCCALAAIVQQLRERPTPPVTALALVWAAFAAVDFFAIGNYFDHYALPLLMPLAIILAPSLRRPALALAVTAVTAIAVATTIPRLSAHATRHRESVAALAATLAPYAGRGCIYVYDGPVSLYQATDSCLPTPYVFPGHLLDANEARATDATASMARLLRGRPSAIVVGDRPTVFPRNAETAALLARALASGYRLAARLPDVEAGRQAMIYVRNDL